MKLLAKLSPLALLRASGGIVGVGLALFASAAMVTTACGKSDESETDADDDTTGGGKKGDGDSGSVIVEPSEPPVFGDSDASGEVADDSCKKMDIVFVVDNSSSMGEEQANLAQNFPKFGAIIDGYKTKSGNVLDYRLAVTTTDAIGNKGAFIKTAEGGKPGGSPSDKCDPGSDRPWIERSDGKPVDYFACRALVGKRGSASERPLASLYLGLTDRIKDGTNAYGGEGFLRDDALLAFVVLTDEDESSNTPPISDYPAMFDALKGGERGRWAAAVIAAEQLCVSPQFGTALEAKKLKQFISEVGKNGVFSSICEGDLTPGLTKALATFDQACKTFPSGPN